MVVGSVGTSYNETAGQGGGGGGGTGHNVYTSAGYVGGGGVGIYGEGSSGIAERQVIINRGIQDQGNRHDLWWWRMWAEDDSGQRGATRRT